MSFTARRISTGEDRDAVSGDLVYRRERIAPLRDIATALEEAYRLAHRALTSQLEATLDQALAAALARIGAELPAPMRMRIVCEQLAAAAGPATAGYLCMCTVDESAYRDAGIRALWPTRIDDALMPGQCRLVTDDGEWTLAFDALIASLGPSSTVSLFENFLISRSA